MAHTIRFSQVLWLLTMAWLAGCGRLGFDPFEHEPPGQSPDAPVAGDAAQIAFEDAPGGRDAPVIHDAPPDTPPAVPQIEVAANLALTTTCGATPVATTLVVKNTGTADLTFTSSTASGAFSVTNAPSVIAPGAMATLGVVPPAAVVGTDRGGATKQGTLTLTTNAGTKTVALVATVAGANIDNNQANLAFTATDGSCPVPRSVTIRNSGTTAVTLNQLAASGVAFTGFTGGTLNAGMSAIVTVRPTICTSGAGTSAVIAFTASSGASGLCVTTPVNVTLSIAASSTSGCACS